MEVNIYEIKNISDAALKIAEVGADPYAVKLMAQKAFNFGIKLFSVDNRAANLLKQESLSAGAEAAVNHNVSRFKKGTSDVLLFVNPKQLNVLLGKLSVQPFGLAVIAEKISEALLNYQRNNFVIKCGSKALKLGKNPVIMGVLNITPDSFSDGGIIDSPQKAVEAALKMVEDGAGIIDIGGESSRPGAAPVSIREEKLRVLPVLKALAKKIKIPISIDTYKPDMAKAALENGADIINDISGLRTAKGKMAKIAARYSAPVIIMHMQGAPRTMQKKPEYKDVIGDIGEFFEERINFALNSGIRKEKIIVDPGIGFGKTLENNIELLKRLKEFKVLGYPVAVGTSRKSFIGRLLNIEKPNERLAGSLASAAWSAINGANILRVHDVKETAQAVKIIEALT